MSSLEIAGCVLAAIVFTPLIGLLWVLFIKEFRDKR